MTASCHPGPRQEKRGSCKRSPAPALRPGTAVQSPTLAFAPGVNEQLASGGKPWRYVPVRGCLLLIYRFSFSFSRLLRQRARMTTEHFTLWETCSFCCFCPHRMFLSAPCEGTGNYRAIHLHPHTFRQILGKACRWRWRKTFCCFCGFSFKEGREQFLF